jgi:hypothetical protein
VLGFANDEQPVEQLDALALEHAELDEPVVLDAPQPPGLDFALDDPRHEPTLRGAPAPVNVSDHRHGYGAGASS